MTVMKTARSIWMMSTTQRSGRALMLTTREPLVARCRRVNKSCAYVRQMASFRGTLFSASVNEAFATTRSYPCLGKSPARAISPPCSAQNVGILTDNDTPHGDPAHILVVRLEPPADTGLKLQPKALRLRRQGDASAARIPVVLQQPRRKPARRAPEVEEAVDLAPECVAGRIVDIPKRLPERVEVLARRPGGVPCRGSVALALLCVCSRNLLALPVEVLEEGKLAELERSLEEGYFEGRQSWADIFRDAVRAYTLKGGIGLDCRVDFSDRCEHKAWCSSGGVHRRRLV